MTRLEHIRNMTAEEVAKKINDLQSLMLDDFCKSTCKASKDFHSGPDEKDCLECCVRWLNEEIHE